MQKELRIGVVGVGHLGKEHARIYHQMPDVKLFAVADSDEKQGKKVAKRFKVKYTDDYRSLLGEVDAVSIASPTSTHFAIARDFLEAGSHVLLEKPMTDSLKTAEQLVTIANDKKLKLQIGHIERFNPAVMEIINRNLQPVYIEALRISPFRFRSGDVSVVLDLMIHDIDIISLLANSAVEKVDAVGINLLGNNEDIANARLVFECGCVANVTASRAALKSMREVRIFAHNCYVSLNYGTMKGRICKIPDNLDLQSINFQKAVPKKFMGLSFEEIFFGRLLEIEKLSMKAHEPLYAELESFIRCIYQEDIPIVPGEDGVRAMRIAHMVSEDIQKNIARAKQRFANVRSGS